VQVILQAGAKLHARSLKESLTALHFAAMFGYHETVALLLERGAEVDARDKVRNYR
jgi:ankyrin repeat protein